MEELKLTEGQIFRVGNKRYVVRHSRIFRIGDPLRSIDAKVTLEECCREFGVSVSDMVKSWDKRRYQVFYEHHTAYIQREAETAIDAVFEMIIWLKENKKI